MNGLNISKKIYFLILLTFALMGCAQLPYELVKNAHPYDVFFAHKKEIEVGDVVMSVLRENRYEIRGGGEYVLASRSDIPDEQWEVRWRWADYGGFWSSTPGTYLSITRSTHRMSSMSLDKSMGSSVEMLAPSKEVKRIMNLIKIDLGA